MTGSTIDMCVNGQRTAVERCCDLRGTTLGVFARASNVQMDGLFLRSLLPGSGV